MQAGVSKFLALLIASVLIACAGVGALGAAVVPKYYLRSRTIEIPYALSPYSGVQKVHLYHSTDKIRFSKKAEVAPTIGKLSCTVADDGPHYFVVQNEYPKERFMPATVNADTIAMEVIVDTTPPKVSITRYQSSATQIMWELDDPNLDLNTLKLEWTPADREEWTRVPTKLLPRASFDLSWYAPPGDVQARITVADRAGNVGSSIYRLRLPEGARSLSPANEVPPPGPNSKVIHVNNKQFQLNYTIDQIEVESVKTVELFMKRGMGPWEARGPVPPGKSCLVEVSKEGRYGFYLRPLSKSGYGPNPPTADDDAHTWVEVDEKAPQVTLKGVVEGKNEFTVNWIATDEWLHSTPITIKYTASRDGVRDWKILKANLENTDSCKCSTEGMPREFYIRVEARDEAGNIGYVEYDRPVYADTRAPKITGVHVTPVPAATPPPPAPGLAPPPRSQSVPPPANAVGNVAPIPG